MGKLADYNVNEIAGCAALIISSIGGLLLICFKSRCTNVRLLWGCYDCQRSVGDIEEAEDSSKSPTTTPTSTPTASSTVPSLQINNNNP